VDAVRLLWFFRRPVGHKAQDIGSWFYILRFINVVSVISNSFLIALTSNWSNSFFGNNYAYRYIFIILFEVKKIYI